MKQITRESLQDHRKAAGSPVTVEDQKVLDSLPPEERELVESLMADNPGLTAARALRGLNAAGM